MFFDWLKRKDPKPEETLPPDGRECYRRKQSKILVLRATVHPESGGAFEGEFLDVSVGGTAVRFTLAADPGMHAGDVAELTIKSKDRREYVRTPARVVYVAPGGEQHWRYGFEFISIGNLYSQLDEFYARFFNRRSSPRVPVPAEQRIPVKVLWGDNELAGKAHDLSATGMSLAIPEDKAERLAEIERVRLRFRIPGIEEELYGPATIRHRLPTLGRALFGIEFDLEREDGLGASAEALRNYAFKRQEELDRWDAALGAA